MDNEVSNKLKIIDDKISSALENISELEKSLSAVRLDDEGKVLKDDCTTLKKKFTSFNQSVEELMELLDMLDLGEE